MVSMASAVAIGSSAGGAGLLASALAATAALRRPVSRQARPPAPAASSRKGTVGRPGRIASVPSRPEVTASAFG